MMMILWGLHGRVLLHGYGCYILCRDIYSHIKKIFQHFFPSYVPMKCQHKAHWVVLVWGRDGGVCCEKCSGEMGIFFSGLTAHANSFIAEMLAVKKGLNLLRSLHCSFLVEGTLTAFVFH